MTAQNAFDPKNAFGLRVFQPEANSELTSGSGDPRRAQADEGGHPTSQSQPDLSALHAKIDALTSLLARATQTASSPMTDLQTDASCHRTGGPVTLSLRHCFDSVKSRNFARREPETWDDYESVIDRLEEVWSGPGPDVRTLTPTILQASFERVATWKNRETWAQHRKYLLSILHDCCRQTTRNPFGIPRGESVLLVEDELPVWELPAQKWFDGRGASPMMKLPALTIQEFDRVLFACESTDDPVWWRTLISFWWFCAMRRTDTLDHLKWYSPQSRLGVDLSRKWLTHRAAKTQEQFDIPLPDWLCVGFQELHRRTGGVMPLVFHRRSHTKNLGRWLYPTLVTICDKAGISYRDPTGFRQSCSSHWDEHDPQLTNRFTAHRESSIVKRHYIVQNEAQLRAAADRHPRPSLPLATVPISVATEILPPQIAAGG